MKLPNISSSDFSGKKVILRADLDVPIKDNQIQELWRLNLLLPTISHILDKQARQILLLGHMGRPEGKPNEKDTLLPIVDFLREKVTPDIEFIPHQPFDLYYQIQEKILASKARVILLENLRFWPEEEANSIEFAQQLVYGMDMFVNDAFGSSHRKHASIVGIPTLSPSTVGLQFEKEVENLSFVFDNPKRPVIALISGIKKDKLNYIQSFEQFCDKVLIAGRLPEFMPEENDDPKLMIARLNPDKEEITIHSMEAFEQEVKHAGTIIVSGPVGMYEDPGHRQGTQRVFIAISQSRAHKIAGGGDTIAAINTLGIAKSFDWISAGGGAMLEFLANRTLPGIQALAV